MYDYFLASRYRNKAILLPLIDQIRQAGKSVYCFLESPQPFETEDPENFMAEFEAIQNWRDDERVKKIFEQDMAALKNSQTIVMILPAGKSAHIECGTAYGLGKKLILIGEQNETESLYLIFNEHYETPEQFIKSLKTA